MPGPRLSGDARRPALLNPEGRLQGALVALAVECAALTGAESAAASAQAVCERDLRSLAAAAEGSVESQTARVGQPRDRALRVLLHDRGRADRATTTALVRVADAPG
ncbi:MAG: hypothetical protein AAGC67_17495 [Myxococcota bacterium]